MDFHAHLANTEIIGFLGGHWDPVSRGTINKNRKRLLLSSLSTQAALLFFSTFSRSSVHSVLIVPYIVIHVVEAFPTASESTGQDSVEMDPASELEVRETMKVRGMKVVGWYHSHPHFEPTPSVRDVENQTNYQLLFRWEGENKSEEGRDGVDKERKGSEAASNVGGGIGVGDSDGDNDDDTQGTFVRLVVPVHPILLRPSQLAESLNQNAHYTPDHARGSLVPASPSKSDSDTNAIEPFIGAIVGTYDIRLPSAKSIISWFNVKRGKPMCLEYVLVEDEAISAHVEKALLDLISHLGFRDQRAVNCRVDFASLWRYAKVQSSNNTAVATTITTEKKEDQGEESRRRSKRKGKNKKKNKAEASIEKRGSAGVIVAGEEDHSSLGGDIVGAVVLMKQTTAGGEQEEGKATSGSLGVEEEEHDVPEEGKAERKEKDILLTREESYKEEPNAKQSEVEQKEGSEEEEESEEEESEESEEEETPGWTLQPVTKFEKFIEAMKHRLPQQYNQLQVSSFLRQVVDELSRVGWSLPSSSQLPAACPYAPISPSSAASSSSTSTSEEGKQSSNASILK